MRIAFISRRFWPLIGGAETMIANLSAELAARGHQATVLTARWDPHWPAESEHRSVHVVRLPQPAERVVGTWRYMRELAGWLRRHRELYDLIYVSQLKHDAYVAVRCGRRFGKPVVLRASGAGVTGDCHWHTIGRCGQRIRRETQRADAIITPSEAIETELLAAGYAAEKIVRLESGVPIPEPPPSSQRRHEARRTLGASNAAMGLADDTPLAVFTGRLHEGKRLDVLIAAWQQIVRSGRDARLWLVGEGPEHEALQRQIGDLGLSGKVSLVGAFDCVEDLLFAADLFVLPSREEGLSQALLEAMAAGRPVVASDIPGNRRAVDDGVQGLLTPVGDATALADAVEQLLDRPEWAWQLGAAGRKRVATEFSLARMVDEHLALFNRLLADRSR
jgi:glycosyltransferase involved in cell wall biosynthesis